jgi:UDP-glucose 4-epimerase
MTSENSIVYVIGGSGFIGKHLISRLLKEKCHVVNIDSFPYENESLNYQQYKLAVEDSIYTLNKIIKPNSIIYYLASRSVPGNEKDIFSDYLNVIKPFIDFLEAIINLNPKIIFLSSAGAVYGNNEYFNKEIDALKPLSIYGIHKVLIESYLFFYKKNFGVDYRIARISNPYGNELPHLQGVGFIDELARKYRSKQAINIYADLSFKRDFIHIDDVINGLIKISNFEITPPSLAINIASGISYSLRDIIILFEKSFGYKIELEMNLPRKVDVKYNLIDIQLIRKYYDFCPCYNIESYIKNINQCS